MLKPLRIIVADDEPLLTEALEATLVDVGHQVIAKAGTGEELVQFAQDLLPDLIITDIKMPGIDGLEAAQRICKEKPVPVIVTSAYHDEEFIERALNQNVMSYLVKPVELESLTVAIKLAMRRFKEFEVLLKENSDLRQTLSDRKIIERAKGVLMKRAQIDEEQAFLRLQKLAREKSERMVDTANAILTADQALKPSDD